MEPRISTIDGYRREMKQTRFTVFIDLTRHSFKACVIESAASLHPGKRVFVLFITSNVTNVYDSLTLSTLIGFQNIRLRHIKVSK